MQEQLQQRLLILIQFFIIRVGVPALWGIVYVVSFAKQTAGMNKPIEWAHDGPLEFDKEEWKKVVD